MTRLRDSSVDMIDVRRAITSFLVGSFLLVSVATQAGAVENDTAALAIAERGLARGLQASDEIEADLADGVLEADEFEAALAAFDAVLAKLDAKGVPGRGPERAREVHEALLAGNLPSEVKAASDRIPGLAKAYGHMRAQLQGEGRGSGANPPVDTP